MMGKAEVRALIDDVFREEALVIGGLAANHGLDDDLVWRLVRNLEAVRGRALRRVDDEPPVEETGSERESPTVAPHPAVSDFLRCLRRD